MYMPGVQPLALKPVHLTIRSPSTSSACRSAAYDTPLQPRSRRRNLPGLEAKAEVDALIDDRISLRAPHVQQNCKRVRHFRDTGFFFLAGAFFFSAAGFFFLCFFSCFFHEKFAVPSCLRPGGVRA